MFRLQRKTAEATSSAKNETAYLPAVDVAENEAGYVIYADVPGANKDSVSVTYEDGIVTLNAKAATTENTKLQTIHREFRLSAGYERAFRIGNDVDAEQISAEITNGVLKVTLPRKASAKRTISVAAK